MKNYKIEIKQLKNFPNAEFEIKIYGDVETKHTVTLDENHYKKLTGGKITPEELVQRSFEFLLKREPNTSILRKFHLKEIQHYFPEYESTISSF